MRLSMYIYFDVANFFSYPTYSASTSVTGPYTFQLCMISLMSQQNEAVPTFIPKVPLELGLLREYILRDTLFSSIFH